ncbi:MAG: CHAD domain-containing protein [Acidobacteriia bacterium]|nr:CHAD domain-containing protein [Terriglobia bacterium]
MAYRFKRDESVAHAIRRIARDELDSVVEQLGQAQNPKRDEAIHEARKSVKKLRALLRLVEPELGAVYRAETQLLRSVGRTLSELRDAGSVIESLDKLQQKFANRLHKPVINSVRRGLEVSKKQLEERDNVDSKLSGIAKKLKAAGKRVKKWPISQDGFPALEPGLEKTFRKGLAAFHQVEKHPSPENYHDWRKRVKDHWYHIRLLQNIWTEWMRGYETALRDVETWLGDDHNLVILRERLIAQPDLFGKEETTELVLDSVDKYQKELRDNAVSFGKRMYREKPRQFVKSIRHLWDEWQTQPTSLEDMEKAAGKDGAGG